MINIDTWRKAWALLDQRERRNAWITMSVAILGAMSSALMVGSILPFLSVLSNPGGISRNSALAWTFKEFDFQSTYHFIVALGLASFAVILLTSLVQIAKTYVVARFTMMRVHSISQRLLIAYLQRPYEFFLNEHTGEMSTRVLSESEQFVNQFLRPASELVAAIFTVVAIIGLLISVDPIIALSALCILGGIYWTVYSFNRSALRRYGDARARANGERFRVASEALGGIKDLKLLGREFSYATRYAGPSKRMAHAIVNVQLLSQVPQVVLQAIALGGIILLCLALLGSQEPSADGALAEILPILGVFAFAGQRMMPEMTKIYQSLAQIQAGSAAVDAVYGDLIGKSKGICFADGDLAPLGLRQSLELIDISYRYPNAEVLGLTDIAVSIRAGEKIGIVGGTGAGKTTLVDIVLGLLPPSEGQIRIDGRLITDKNRRAWQKSVGYVQQNIFLTDANIFENIALGVPPEEIDQVRVRRSAEIAQIDSFIQHKLPYGYRTSIGERGVRLSGGQRQRIGIARALYSDADLIVFDEATSALDTLTERDVMAAIEALPGEKTILIVAHRLSTVKSCDRIIILNDGRVVGCDTWENLMSNNHIFRLLANSSNAAA